MPYEETPLRSVPCYGWHTRKLLRLSRQAYREAKLTTFKLAELKQLSGDMLRMISDLSEQEAKLSHTYPTATERFQYLIDKITQAMGREVDTLSQRWKVSR